MDKLMEKLDDMISKKTMERYVMHGIARNGGKHIKVFTLAESYKEARSILEPEMRDCIGVSIYKMRR